MDWQSIALAVAAPVISVAGVLGAAWFAFRGRSIEVRTTVEKEQATERAATTTAQVTNLIDERTRLYARIESLEARALKEDERYELIFEKYIVSQTELATLSATVQMLQRELEQYKALQQENQQLRQDNQALRSEMVTLNKANQHLRTELSSARALTNTLQTEMKQLKMHTD